jgi:hypothetical protein
MRLPDHKLRTAEAARDRLLSDQATRPINEQRAKLQILAQRLDRAGRLAITQDLAVRVRTDRRFAPMLGKLFRMSLEG